MPGPHDFAVRSDLLIASIRHMLPIEVLKKALKRRSSCALATAHGKTALRLPHAPDAAASTASHPT
jgi:hypothetical protein